MPLTSLPYKPYNTSPTGLPSFQDILERLRFGGEDKFKQGLGVSSFSGGIRPETQSILDMIRKRQLEDEARAVSGAQALAGRRGIAGSSTEQFGTAQAAGEVAKSARDAEAQVLLNNLNQDNAFRELQARALFERAGQEGTLTQDEINSLRSLELGREGLGVARENIAASRDAAKREGKNDLLGNIISGVAPYALPYILGSPAAGSKGFIPSLISKIPGFGGGGAAAGGAASAYGVPGGLIGPAAAPGGGIGAFALPAVGVAAGLALYEEGRKLLRKQGFSKNSAKALSVIPGVGLTVAAVSKAFSGKGKTSDGNTIANVSRELQTNLTDLRKLRSDLSSGKITEAQYREAASPIAESAGVRAGQATRQGSAWASAINPTWQAFVNEGFVRAGQGKWVLA